MLVDFCKKLLFSRSKKIKLFVFLPLLLISSTIFAADEKKEDTKKKSEEPPAIGNFILRASQQPGPLFSFAQNILDKNQVKFNFGTNYFQGVNRHFGEVYATAVYGVSDRFAILYGAPYAVSFYDTNHRSSGIEDNFVQAEYAFYSHSTKKYSQQATLVTSMFLPTGSAEKSPSTGYGSAAFFLGTTFNRTYVAWYGFLAPGVLITTTYRDIKFGNQYTYQGGIGRNIFNIGKKWSFCWLVEGIGQFVERTKINGVNDPNSGGNIIFAIPSLSLASNKFSAQIGYGFPVSQHLFGSQGRIRYLITSNFSYTF